MASADESEGDIEMVECPGKNGNPPHQSKLEDMTQWHVCSDCFMTPTNKTYVRENRNHQQLKKGRIVKANILRAREQILHPWESKLLDPFLSSGNMDGYEMFATVKSISMSKFGRTWREKLRSVQTGQIHLYKAFGFSSVLIGYQKKPTGGDNYEMIGPPEVLEALAAPTDKDKSGKMSSKFLIARDVIEMKLKETCPDRKIPNPVQVEIASKLLSGLKGLHSLDKPIEKFSLSKSKIKEFDDKILKAVNDPEDEGEDDKANEAEDEYEEVNEKEDEESADEEELRNENGDNTVENGEKLEENITDNIHADIEEENSSTAQFHFEKSLVLTKVQCSNETDIGMTVFDYEEQSDQELKKSHLPPEVEIKTMRVDKAKVKKRQTEAKSIKTKPGVNVKAVAVGEKISAKSTREKVPISSLKSDGLVLEENEIGSGSPVVGNSNGYLNSIDQLGVRKSTKNLYNQIPMNSLQANIDFQFSPPSVKMQPVGGRSFESKGNSTGQKVKPLPGINQEKLYQPAPLMKPTQRRKSQPNVTTNKRKVSSGQNKNNVQGRNGNKMVKLEISEDAMENLILDK